MPIILLSGFLNFFFVRAGTRIGEERSQPELAQGGAGDKIEWQLELKQDKTPKTPTNNYISTANFIRNGLIGVIS